MNESGVIPVPPAHPLFEAVRVAEVELRSGRTAAAEGNLGRVRVCARRAVGAFLQRAAPALGEEVGANAMANLRYLHAAGLPEPEHLASVRLAGGARSALEGGPISEDPLADAAIIINYFLRRASASPDHTGDDGADAGLRP